MLLFLDLQQKRLNLNQTINQVWAWHSSSSSLFFTIFVTFEKSSLGKAPLQQRKNLQKVTLCPLINFVSFIHICKSTVRFVRFNFCDIFLPQWPHSIEIYLRLWFLICKDHQVKIRKLHTVVFSFQSSQNILIKFCSIFTAISQGPMWNILYAFTLLRNLHTHGS